MDCDLCLFLRRARTQWKDRSGMPPISLKSNCKLKVLSETISLEAVRKYDPPRFLWCCGFVCVSVFRLCSIFVVIIRQAILSDMEMKSYLRTCWSFMYDVLSFESFGLSNEHLFHFCETKHFPPCKLWWHICGRHQTPSFCNFWLKFLGYVFGVSCMITDCMNNFSTALLFWIL